MQLFFAGAESQAHLDTLQSCGVNRVAVSISNLARHTRDYAVWATTAVSGPGLVRLRRQPHRARRSRSWNCWRALRANLRPSLAPSTGQPRRGSTTATCSSCRSGTATTPASCAATSSSTTAPCSPTPWWTTRSPCARQRRLWGECPHSVALTGRIEGHREVRPARRPAPGGPSQKHGETQVWTGNRMVRMNSDDKHLKRQRYADGHRSAGRRRVGGAR